MKRELLITDDDKEFRIDPSFGLSTTEVVGMLHRAINNVETNQRMRMIKEWSVPAPKGSQSKKRK